MSDDGAVKLLLAEDQAMVRGALAALLNLEDDLEVVAEVGRGDEVVEAARAEAVDVALLDIAKRLHLSEGTVRNYLSACIQKTGARNRTEAVQAAQQRGWL